MESGNENKESGNGRRREGGNEGGDGERERGRKMGRKSQTRKEER